MKLAEGRAALALALERLKSAPPVAITINWAAVLFVCFFVAYGYFGAVASGREQVIADPIAHLLTLVVLIGGLVGFGRLAQAPPPAFLDTVSFGARDAAVGLFVGGLLLLLSFNRLRIPLFVDEISYAMSAVRHSIVLSAALTKDPTPLDQLPFRFLVQAVSLMLLAALASLLLLARRLSWNARIVAAVAIFVIGRVAVTVVGGNQGPHPPLNSIPPLLFGSVLGMVDWAFKASSLFAFAAFMVICYRLLARVLSFQAAVLFVLAIGTAPLWLHLAGVVEPSLWGAMCFSYVVLEMMTAKQINYVRVASVVAIATLMRQPSFSAMLVVAGMWCASRLIGGSGEQRTWRTFAFALIPCFLFVPFLTQSILFGTPSTEGLAGNTATLDRIVTVLRSNVIELSIINSISAWWIVFIPFAFIPLRRETISRNVVLLVLAGWNTVMYYAISPHLYGLAKYQAEYAMPFAIAGALFVALRLSAVKHHLAGFVLSAGLLGMVAMNLADWRRFPHGTEPLNIYADDFISEIKTARPGRRLLVADAYDYHGAFAFIKARGLAGCSYSMGYTYGIMPEIMSGYSVAAIRSVAAISERLEEAERASWSGGAASLRLVEQVAGDSAVSAVLLGVVPDKEERVSQLRRKGWRKTASFENARYGSSVIVMERSPRSCMPLRLPAPRFRAAREFRRSEVAWPSIGG